jgi:hypothetical protein
MAADIKKLRVQWRRQERGFFCGPACLQMVLGFLGLRRTQQQLFDDVVARSTGTRPPDAPCNANRACYPTQVCYRCGSWECWDTDPEAFTTTLKDRAPAVRFELHYDAETDVGTNRIIAAIRPAQGVPPVATVGSFNHWIVVNGYHLEDAKEIARRNEDPDLHPAVKGLYLLDPLVRTARMRLVQIDEWNERFGLVDCGDHLDEHIVIAGSRARRRRRDRRPPRGKPRRIRR